MTDAMATILLGLFTSLSQPAPDLYARLQAGEPLRVATRTNPVTFFEGPRGPLGFEAALVQRFAEDIGVEVEYVVADGPADVITMIEHGQADIAAAGLSVTARRATRLRIGPTYQQVTEHVVHREDGFAPQPSTTWSSAAWSSPPAAVTCRPWSDCAGRIPSCSGR